MKPTYGRVSRRGVVPLAFSLDHVGPMTRTVRDNALMLQVIAGHDPADPASADEPVPDYGAMLGQGVKGLRIGLIRHFYTKDVAGDPEQVDALDAAVRLFAAAGAETTEITLPPLQDFSACGQIILAAEAYAVHEQWLKERPRAGARTAPRRRRAARSRLSPGGTLAPPAPRPGGSGVREHRCGDYRLQHGSRLPDRRRYGARRQLLASGADAVQRYRPAGAGNSRGL